MQYDLQVETVSSIRRRLHFTLNQGEVKGELDRAFHDLKRKVRLPGFRPGKVPRQLLEARFGGQIRGEVSGRLIERAWREAAGDLDVAGQPSLEDQGDLSARAAFSFTIGVDVKPEVELADYKGLKVSYTAREVTDADVEGRIEARLASKSRLVEVEDGRGVVVGDLVLSSIKLEKDGEVVADEPGTMVTVAGDRYYPGIESLLVGLSVEGTATGEVTISEASAYEHLRGQVVQATVGVLAIQANEAPELNDELAAEFGYEGGVDGMRTAIRMEIESAVQEEGRTQARVSLLQKLVEANEFEVPEGMVAEQLQALTEELKVRRAYAGEDPRGITFSEAELSDLRGRAVFAAKSSVILAAVARQEDVSVEESDIEARIDEIAQMRGQTVQAIRGYLERENAIPVLRDRIQEEKTLEFLLEAADLEVSAAPADAPSKPKKSTKSAKTSKAKAKGAKSAKAAPAKAEAAAAPAWNKKMKKAELLEVAKELGLKVTTKLKKDEIIAALEAHQS